MLSSPVAARSADRWPHELETQRAGDRRRLDQFDGHRIAEPVGYRAPDKSAARFVEAEIFVADGARRNKTVGAGLVEFDEQAGAGDAGNMAVESGADPVGQKMRDEPVRRFALGLHGAAFGGGNIGGDFGKRAHIHVVGWPSAPSFSGADQSAVHDEIGIAADRRGEMRVAAQIEAEMAVILR